MGSALLPGVASHTRHRAPNDGLQAALLIGGPAAWIGRTTPAQEMP